MNTKRLFVIIQMIIGLALMTMIAGCSKDKNNDADDNNNTSGVEPLISAVIINYGNPVSATSVSIGIVDASHQGGAITNAIVKVNNILIPHISAGSYTLSMTTNPIAPNSSVTLEVQCAGQTYTVTATMPESGSNHVDIPGCAAGSFMTLGPS